MKHRVSMTRAVSLAIAALLLMPATASGASESTTLEQLVRVVTLRDYNTRVVVAGTMMLGAAAGVVGTYMLLRKRSLIADALSHATLPGIGIAFLVMVAMGGSGKSLPGLLLGAALAGLVGMLSIVVISRHSRIKEDAALGIVLSVFFGAGIALLGIIQKMPVGSAAGLDSFIYGKTASMLQGDAIAIGGASLLVVTICVVLHKEFAVLSFDEEFAGSQGWPVLLLDVIMMSLVGIVTAIGLQAVGLILMIALIIIPPAAARFWSPQLRTLLLVGGAIGAASGLLGAGFSAMVPRLPAGAIIVVVASAIFLISMIFGSHRGVLVLEVDQRRLRRRVARQHLLRAMYELSEAGSARGRDDAITLAELLPARTWSPAQLKRSLRRAAREGLVRVSPDGAAWMLSAGGRLSAERVVRNHRLWELYLIHHADIAPSHVDRDADQIEHVLDAAMIRSLERLLAGEAIAVPASPHLLERRPHDGSGGR